MGRGRDRARPGVAVVALSGVLAGGASFGAGVADATPTAPPPPRCVIGPTTYVQPPAPGRPLVEALGAAKKCVDAITDHLLDREDLAAYGLRPVSPVAAPTTTAPKTTPSTTTPKPSPTTTTPKPSPTTTTPTSTAPVVTTPGIATPGTPGKTTTTAPAVGSGGGGSAGTAPGNSAGRPVEVGPKPSTVETARIAAPSVPEPGPAAVAPAVPVALPPAPVAADALPAIGDVPLGDLPAGEVVPFDGSLLEPVADASFLDPMGVPDLGSLPGEVAPLRTLGDDVSAVTTSSRVQALGLDGLHRGGGLPAVLGVTILSGLSGFALRHRVLARIRATTAGDGPAPDPDDDPDGRHSA